MNLKTSFDSLIASFEQLLLLSHAALAPDASPEQRALAREAIALYFANRPQG